MKFHLNELLLTDEELTVLFHAITEKKDILETIIGCVTDQKVRAQYAHMLDICKGLQTEFGRLVKRNRT